MKGTSQAIECSSIGKERIREGRANKLASMCGNVATLVITVDGDVETEELGECLVVTEAKKSRQIGRVVLVGIDGRKLAFAEDITVNSTGNVGQFGNEVHRILEGRSPVVLLVDALLVRLGKCGIMVKSSDGQRELGHGVKSGWASVKELLYEFRNGGTGSPVLGELCNLLLSGNFTSDEQPEKSFRERLRPTGSLGKKLLALGNSLATEADALLGI
jgi:hypothetical protein